MKEEKGLNDISHSSLLSATDISVAFVSIKCANYNCTPDKIRWSTSIRMAV